MSRSTSAEPPAGLGRLAIELATCGSTNDEAARLAGRGAPHGTVVSARRQTAGRGRLGRAWHSPPGNLHLSVVLRPALPPAAVPPITLAAGVAIAELVADLGATPELKWPNDVLVGGKKLGGILTEMASRGASVDHVVVGVGLDLVGPPPDELAAIATWLDREVGRPLELAAVRAAAVAALDRWLGAYLAGGVGAIAPSWLRHARLGDRRIAARVDDRPVEGRAVGLDGHGRLELVADDRQHYYVAAGEIALL
jgi:BirA family transcriptional regulator, biotin operon repressor / biotin---[acetyl-CoA-carboxylase] ligase